MLATPVSKPFSDKDWIFEVKWDGFRALAYVNNKFSLRSRNGSEFKYNFPEITELRLLAKEVVVDGELIIMRRSLPDFQAMLERGKATRQRDIEKMVNKEPATYVVFDILEKDGKSLANLPLMERKEILKQSVKEGSHVCLADYVEGNGEDYYRVATERGLEGVVAKKKSSIYEEGRRSECWLKIKKLRSVDCVIFGFSEGKGNRASTFGALIAGLYDREGKPVYVANIGTGFNHGMLCLLLAEFQKIKADVIPFKIEGMGRITWLKPLLVCEVIYQEATRECRLRAPRFERIRLDKKPEECTLDQII
jgi:bifunctional non-homologous end joining protein LigD